MGIMVGGIPSNTNNRTGAQIKKWCDAQTTNVSVEASNKSTPEARLQEIVLNAKASDVAKVASNPAISVATIDLILKERLTMETLKRISSNPAAPTDLLQNLASRSKYSHYVTQWVVDRANANLAKRQK